MLKVVFEKLEVVYTFLLLFFSLLFSIGKRSILAKIWGEGRMADEEGGYSPPSPSPTLHPPKKKN